MDTDFETTDLTTSEFGARVRNVFETLFFFEELPLAAVAESMRKHFTDSLVEFSDDETKISVSRAEDDGGVVRTVDIDVQTTRPIH